MSSGFLRVLVLGIPLSADGVRRDNHEMRLGRVQCGVTIAARKETCDPDSSSIDAPELLSILTSWFLGRNH
jgi:hypothetical protein